MDVIAVGLRDRFQLIFLVSMHNSDSLRSKLNNGLVEYDASVDLIHNFLPNLTKVNSSITLIFPFVHRVTM